MKKALALILVFALSAIAMSSCAVSGDISRYSVVDYMKNITPAQQTPETLDSTFRDAYADFALRLYGEVKKEKNTLISPLSVMLALAMTANGADGATLEGMEKALGERISQVVCRFPAFRRFVQNVYRKFDMVQKGRI